MANSIDNLMVSDGPAVFYDEDFKIVLESHLTYFRNPANNTVVPVASNDAYRFEGDLYGLLHSYNIQPQYHWIIMRVNEITAPYETTESLSHLLIPNTDLIENLRQLYMISHKIS